MTVHLALRRIPQHDVALGLRLASELGQHGEKFVRQVARLGNGAGIEQAAAHQLGPVDGLLLCRTDHEVCIFGKVAQAAKACPVRVTPVAVHQPVEVLVSFQVVQVPGIVAQRIAALTPLSVAVVQQAVEIVVVPLFVRAAIQEDAKTLVAQAQALVHAAGHIAMDRIQRIVDVRLVAQRVVSVHLHQFIAGDGPARGQQITQQGVGLFALGRPAQVAIPFAKIRVQSCGPLRQLLSRRDFVANDILDQ